VSGTQLRQDGFDVAGQQIGNAPLAARRRQHLGLQAALAIGDVDARDQLLRRYVDAAVHQHGGERCRAALVLVLREERYLDEFDR
jgi:hypothetical protein